MHGTKTVGSATDGTVALDPSWGARLWALLGATRPHFFALPIGAGLAGMGASGAQLEAPLVFLVVLITGGGWASGQLLNDLQDREADAIDAPDRASVRGLLPPAATVVVALILGVTLLVLLIHHTPVGWFVGLLSMFLILTYNKCKALPGLGNISHGALMGCATLVGGAVASPKASLLAVASDSASAALLAGSWAALYLQGNYEKDVRGDAAAGYRTLAHVLGRRGSAMSRVALAAVSGWFLVHALTHPVHIAVALAAIVSVAVSAVTVALENTGEAPLKAYRWTVHGAILGMLALGGPALSVHAFVTVTAAAVCLTELAFARSRNP